MTNKILVSIASYKDVDIINTIEDLYEKAEQPNRVYVGLFLQDTPKEISRICSFFSNFIYKANLKIKTISFEDAKGCGWARNIILKELYDNENYFMCVDSHSRFLKKWDSVYIDAYKKAPANAVISAFPQPFDFVHNKEQEIYSLLIYLYGLDIYAIPQNVVWHKYIVEDSYRDLFNPKQIKYNTDFLSSLKTKETNRTIKGWVNLIQKDCDECKKTKQLNS